MTEDTLLARGLLDFFRSGEVIPEDRAYVLTRDPGVPNTLSAVNLVNYPALGANQNGWGGTGVTRVADPTAPSGSGYVARATHVDGLNVSTAQIHGSGQQINIDRTKAHSAGIWVRRVNAAGCSRIRFLLPQYDSTGTFIATLSAKVGIDLPVGEWVLVKAENLTGWHANTAKIWPFGIYPDVGYAAAAGGMLEATAAIVVEGATLPPYFDGDTPATSEFYYKWTGLGPTFASRSERRINASLAEAFPTSDLNRFSGSINIYDGNPVWLTTGGLPATKTVRNYIFDPSSNDGTVGPWSPYSSTNQAYTTLTSEIVNGRHCFTAVKNTASLNLGMHVAGAGLTPRPAGTVLTFSAWVSNPVGSVDTSVRLLGRDDTNNDSTLVNTNSVSAHNGALVSASTVEFTVPADGVWRRVWLTMTVPASRTLQHVYLYKPLTSQQVGETIRFRDVMVTDGTVLEDAFDGSTPDTAQVSYEWLGTPFASLSIARFFTKSAATSEDYRDLAGLGVAGRIIKVVSEYFGTFDDFAYYDSALPGHPFGGWIVNTSSDRNTPTGDLLSPWKRFTRTVVPPRGARFVVPKIGLSGGVGNTQYLDAFQMEVVPINLGSPVIPAFSKPRRLKVRVRPTRLNYSINPTFLNGTTNDVSYSGVTLSRDGSRSVGGGASLKVVVASGAAIPVRVHENQYLPVVAGEPLAVSFKALVEATSLSGSYKIAVDYFTESLVPVSTVYSDSAVKTRSNWGTISFLGEVPARADRARISLVHAASAPASTDTFWIDQVLIEKSASIGEYFDGNSGDDYLWKSSGTPGQTWSYFYEDRVQRHYILERTLRENVPLGISIGDPEYAEGTVHVQRYGNGQYGSGAYGG